MTVGTWKTLRYAVCCVAGLVIASPSASPGALGGGDQPPHPALRTGSICLVSIADPTSGEKSLYNYTGGNPSPEYSVQVGKGPIVQFPHSPKATGKGILITGLPLDQSYMARIRHQGKPIESFRFRFDDEDRGSLCLFTKAFYLTWQLWPADLYRPACRCNGAKATPWAEE